MPRVGNKQFPYTREGVLMARAESRLTGLPISSETPFVDRIMREEMGGPRRPMGQMRTGNGRPMTRPAAPRPRPTRAAPRQAAPRQAAPNRATPRRPANPGMGMGARRQPSAPRQGMRY